MKALKTVLIADDDDDIRRLGMLCLRHHGGFEILGARNGREAVTVARARKPDLILLDSMMPDVDGPAALAMLRDDADFELPPVVFLTARAGSEDVERYLAEGAAAVIAKPFQFSKLPSQLLAVLEARGQS